MSFQHFIKGLPRNWVPVTVTIRYRLQDLADAQHFPLSPAEGAPGVPGNRTRAIPPKLILTRSPIAHCRCQRILRDLRLPVTPSKRPTSALPRQQCSATLLLSSSHGALWYMCWGRAPHDVSSWLCSAATFSGRRTQSFTGSHSTARVARSCVRFTEDLTLHHRDLQRSDRPTTLPSLQIKIFTVATDIQGDMQPAALT